MFRDPFSIMVSAGDVIEHGKIYDRKSVMNNMLDQASYYENMVSMRPVAIILYNQELN